MGLKIALVSPYDFPYPGGVTEHIVGLAKGIRQRGHEVHILAACSGYQDNIFPDTRAVTNRVTVFPVGGAKARVGLSPFSYVRIKKILQHELYDVIHLQEPLTPSITWWVLMQAYGLPHTVTIGTFHAYHEKPNWLYKHGRPVFGKFFTMLNNLIAVSGAACHFASQMFPGEYHIIPNGVELKRFGKSAKDTFQSYPAKQTTILFVGRLDKRKGFLRLLEAFISLKPDYPQLQLQVIGPFESKSCDLYRKMALAQGVTDIEFVGYVPPRQLPSYYHNADIFCAPSLGYESFGIVLLEAMAAGLPIVATNIAGYRSLVTPGQEGLLVPPDESKALAGALRQLLDHPCQRWEMARCGRVTARQYSWDVVVDRTLAVYLDTIQRTPKTQSEKFYHIESNSSSYGHIQRRQANHVE